MTVVDAPLVMPAKKFKEDGKSHKANAKAIEDFAQQIYGSLVPVGVVLPYAGGAAPPGWVFCDGSAVSRDAFYNLWLVIGTTYGAGDGTTTFNIPDLKGTTLADVRLPVSVGATAPALGEVTATNRTYTSGNLWTGVALNFIIKT